LAAALLLSAGSALAAPAAKPAAWPTYLDADGRRVLAAWLAGHPGYRLLNDADCRCDDDLREIRQLSQGVWRPEPGFHPYYRVGDFNGDGRSDLAVGLGTAGTPGRFQVLVIDHYRGRRGPVRTYLSPPYDLGEALFFGAPRPRPRRLLVGPFDSEGLAFEPLSAGRYRLR
jgi:hypothetical protein